MIAATVLTGGLSTRMGFPKALLKYRGRTFLENILDVTAATGIARRIVVVGPDPDKILSNHDLRGVTVVTNPDPASGPVRSIQLAIEQIQPHPVPGLLVWPVDFPHVEVSTIEAMVERFRQGDVSVVVPEYDGRRGHPVLFGRDVFEELMAAGPPDGAAGVVRKNPGRVAHVVVDDPAVVDDLNTPEAYRRLLRHEDRIRG